MGEFVESLSNRGLVIGVIVVLVIAVLIPGIRSGISQTQLIRETSGDILDSYFPVIVSDDESLLNFSSYLGGSNDEYSMSVDSDAAGNIYVAGTTCSYNFPLVNPLDDTIEACGREGFITKISPTGELIYSSYLGGSGNDEIHDIFVDDAGFVYLTGQTSSENFPIKNAVCDMLIGQQDCFVCKINQAGTAFIYSTFIGGSSVDSGVSICVNELGEAYILGETISSNFPTVHPYDGSYGGYDYFKDCFVVKLSSSGNVLLYSTYIGGFGDEWAGGIVVDAEGAMYVTGETHSVDFPTLNAFRSTLIGYGDAFLLKLNPSGTSLNYSTFLGGSGWEKGCAIGVDSLGRCYITGWTNSGNFPLIRPIDGGSSDLEGFLTVFNPDGLSLNFSTYFGGAGNDGGSDLVVSGVGSVYVGGRCSSNVPYIIKNSYDSSFNGGLDALLMRIDIDRGIVLLGSYFGGSTLDEATSITVGNNGIISICGWTFSSDFPMRNPVDSTYDPGGFEGYDAFISSIVDSSDSDMDNIPDNEEIQLGTDRYNPDTDFDLLGDYLEVYQLGTNPLTNCTYENGTLDGDLDHDGDALTNVEELYVYGTDLLNWDSDGDLLSDGFEVHVVGSLPTKFDSDFDSLSDWDEYMIFHTNCLSPDSDRDIMTDAYEVNNNLNPLVNDADGDLDGDTLTNLQEYLIGCSANSTDSDFDGLPDNWEVNYGFNPLVDDAGTDSDQDTLTNYDEFIYGTNPLTNDSDSDQLSDAYEILVLGTNPLNADTDMDTLPDAWEVNYGLDPLHDDSMLDLDGDGLTNLEEYELGTRPDIADTDSDSFSDAWEVRNGSNPTDPSLSLVQAFFYHFPSLSALFAVSISLPAIYVIGQRKIKNEEQKKQDILSMEIKELLDSISDSLDSED